MPASGSLAHKSPSRLPDIGAHLSLGELEGAPAAESGSLQWRDFKVGCGVGCGGGGGWRVRHIENREENKRVGLDYQPVF